MKIILVMDDDSAIRMLYSEEFRDEGYEVIVSGDGSRLRDLIDENGPQLLLMDMRLRECRGLDLLQEIRNRYPELRLILCTTYPAFKHGMNSVAADEYVVKSGDLLELKAKVKKMLGQREPAALEGKDNAFQGKAPVNMIQESFGWAPL